MRVLSVDLASKFSAGTTLGHGGEVLRQFDSASMTAFGLARRIREDVEDLQPDLVIIEDVPYHVKGQAQTKSIFRLQGIVIDQLGEYLDRVLWINPATWQNHYPGVGRAPKEYTTASARLTYREEQARLHALRLGYAPPPLVQNYRDGLPEGAKELKKHTGPLHKTMTDYIDGYLIGRWAQTFTEAELRAKSGVQPVLM